MSDFSVPAALHPAYHGTLNATVFELASPDTPIPTNHIRTTQNWGVDATWEMEGVVTTFLVDEFRVHAYLEGIGSAAPEIDLGPEVVMTTAGVPSGPQKLSYSAKINVAAGTVPPGVYKLVTLIQLFDDAPPANPYPIIGTVEGPMVTVFKPN